MIPAPEFYFREIDTFARVETQDADAVVIRVTRATFSETRKEFFLRHLAAEGFVPDACRWNTGPKVTWLVDGRMLCWRLARDQLRRRLLPIAIFCGVTAAVAIAACVLNR